MEIAQLPHAVRRLPLELRLLPALAQYFIHLEPTEYGNEVPLMIVERPQPLRKLSVCRHGLFAGAITS